MKSFKIKTKILAGLGIVGFGYIIFMTIIQWSSFQTQQSMHIAADSLFPAAIRMQEAQSAFQRLNKRYNDAILLQDKSQLNDAAQDTQAIVDDLNIVYSKTGYDAKRQQQIAALRDKIVEVEAKAGTTYTAMIDAKDNITDDIQTSIKTLAQSNSEITASLQQSQNDVANDFALRLKEVSTFASRQSRLGLLMCVLGVGCGLIASILTERYVSKPLTSLVHRLKDIAEGEADLTKRLELQTTDEIGEASKWFNTFMDRLHDVIYRISTNTERLALGTQTIADSAQQMADHVGVQRSQVNQMAAAMQQMADSVQEISQSSNQAAQGAVDAGELAASGGSTVNGAINSIKQVADATLGTEDRIKRLGQSAQQIGRIINVIDEIASQTNLLALNAAIEAARAGEQGRGFAVVAGEVRNLAVRTTGATKEIADMINAIQTEARNAAEGMHRAAERVEIGVQDVTQAGDALHQIIGSAERVKKMITQIASASTEQSATTLQVDENMQEIAKQAEETARGAAQSSSSCQEVTLLASDLRRLVSVFKVGCELKSASEPNPIHIQQLAPVFKKTGRLPQPALTRI